MNEKWLYGSEKLPGLSRNGPHRDLNLRSLVSESRVLTITPHLGLCEVYVIKLVTILHDLRQPKPYRRRLWRLNRRRRKLMTRRKPYLLGFRFLSCFLNKTKLKSLRRPGIEPGSTAWKAAMLTTIPPTLLCKTSIEE